MELLVLNNFLFTWKLQAQAAVHGLSYADIAAKAEELNQTDPATLIKPLVVVSAGESLPKPFSSHSREGT